MPFQPRISQCPCSCCADEELQQLEAADALVLQQPLVAVLSAGFGGTGAVGADPLQQDVLDADTVCGSVLLQHALAAGVARGALSTESRLPQQVLIGLSAVIVSGLEAFVSPLQPPLR